ncbi:DUF2194 domain-containing protein [Psychrilyobacter atlanticus]|uniref:DUF2194 domain-containing protein n=1 Tax=Psychrilyobacter atlanticus TaxID=271091 RepID=UPI00040A07DA|nr:DUF2194 domain-containing protein [Psychrilyobacter atlanticus]
MKIKYLVGLILVLGLSLQFFRVNELNEMVDIKQGYKYKEVTYSDSKDIPNGELKHLVLISHINSDSQREMALNIKEVFKYAKVSYDLNYLSKLKKGEVYRYESIIISTDDYKYLEKDIYEEIKDYVADGGNLIILMNSYFNPFNDLAGIEKLKGFTIGSGLKFKKNIFPGIYETKIIGEEAESITNSLLDVSLNKDVDIIAETFEGYPIIFQRKVGEGKVIYSNATFFVDRSVNGILIQLISYGNSIFLQNIVNTKVVDIDDFPAPLPSGKNELIYSQYKMNTRNFFREIWWPDMKKLAIDNNLIYTGYIIGTYEDINKKEKFTPFNELNIQDKIYFGRELLTLNGEVGIHGYNHQPLGLSEELNHNYNYKDWETEEDMAESIVRIRENLKGMYSGLEAKVYVPPSNMLGVTGKKVVKENLPSLEVLSGIYSGTEEKGVLITHIGWDKDQPSLYNFPRFSSGFLYNDVMMLNVYNGIALYGIFHHFIHPDDILDEQRGEGKDWKVLKKELSLYFENVNEKFGFLRAQTAYDGYREVLKLDELKVHIFKKKGSIDVYFEKFPGKTYHYFRLRDNEVKEVLGGAVHLISYDEHSTLYLLEADKNKISIILK